jgi:hypothetical protein
MCQAERQTNERGPDFPSGVSFEGWLTLAASCWACEMHPVHRQTAYGVLARTREAKAGALKPVERERVWAAASEALMGCASSSA